MDKQLLSYLESSWSDEDGFFYQLRAGNVKPESVDKLIDQLGSFNPENDSMLPKELVSMIWYIPIFMEWQTERVAQNGDLQKGEYENIKSKVQSAVEAILGIP